MRTSTILFTALLMLLVSLGTAHASQSRWYTPEQAEQGAGLFAVNCSGCHGDVAQGQSIDWRRPLADGSLPAPPLNGSAHAWHHPLKDLLWVISEGSMPRGGKMPGFKAWLSRENQLAVIAFFQNFWNEQTYQAWVRRGGLKS